MSRDAKWIWNAETPARVPAGARISAGKSGSVARSFPSTAVAVVNLSPVSCIPSPESPANRTTTRSFSSTVLVMRSCDQRALGVLYRWYRLPGRSNPEIHSKQPESRFGTERGPREAKEAGQAGAGDLRGGIRGVGGGGRALWPQPARGRGHRGHP